MRSFTGLGALHHARQRRGARHVAGRMATRIAWVSWAESRTERALIDPRAGSTDEPGVIALKQ